MTAAELTQCVEAHEKNASQIADDLGVSKSGMSYWMNGKRSIDERDAKLLRLYFYGEIPFDHIREGRTEGDLQEILRFSPAEWHVITILSNRLGISQGAWIAEQVRTIIAGRAAVEPGIRQEKSKTA